jgi:putative ABC transport system permease protein
MWSLILKLFARDWQSGELKVLIAALLVAVSAVSSINFFSNRIEIAMQEETSRFIGADLQLSGPREAETAWLEQAESMGLEWARTLVFPSVASTENGFQLSSVRAVTDYYPLKGTLNLSRADGTVEPVNNKPAVGEIWMDSTLFRKLDLQFGDLVEVGVAEFKVTGIIEPEPGRGGGLLNFLPRLVMNQDDVGRAEVIQAGSRVNWQYQVTGAREDIEAFSAWFRDNANETWNQVGAKSGVPRLERTLQRAEAFLGFASLAILVLAGIAIAMVANRYAEHHFDHAAILRCFGCKQNDVLKIYGSNLLLIGITTSVVGAGLGYIIHLGLVELMSPLLPPNLPQPDMTGLYVALATGISALIGFALPALIRLGKVAPLRVLRKDLTPLTMSSYATYALTLFSLALIMWWQTGDVVLVGNVLGAGIGIAIIFSIVAQGFLKLGLYFGKFTSGASFFGIKQVSRHSAAARIQVLAFGLAMLIMMLVILIRSDLLMTWQAKLDQDTPNHFIVNIEGYETEPLEQFFEANNIKHAGLFPMIRSRVELPDTATRPIRREVNISWATEVPVHNELVGGVWAPEQTSSGLPAMSLEQNFAQGRNIQIGDIINFKTGGFEYSGEVTSFRTVKWDSFKPNFFIMFTSDAIKDMPSEWMTSFYLDKQQKPLLGEMLSDFPAATLIELDAIMEQIQRVIDQVSIAVEFVLLFVMVAGLMVLLAAVQASMDIRNFESTVLRTLGARRSYLRKAIVSEFGFIGLMAGIMAAAGTELAAWGLYRYVFDLPYSLHGWIWLAGPLVGFALITTAGYFASQGVLKQSPMASLRQI